MWRDDAACRGHPTDLWYTDTHEARSAARAICRTCPVTAECLAEALSLPFTWGDHGIWGGLIARERRFLKSQQRRDSRPY